MFEKTLGHYISWFQVVYNMSVIAIAKDRKLRYVVGHRSINYAVLFARTFRFHTLFVPARSLHPSVLSSSFFIYFFRARTRSGAVTALGAPLVLVHSLQRQRLCSSSRERDVLRSSSLRSDPFTVPPSTFSVHGSVKPYSDFLRLSDSMPLIYGLRVV